MEKEREQNISVLLPLECPPLGVLACNPGMCPDWELNQWPFGSQAGTQSTEPHQPGLNKQNLLLVELIFPLNCSFLLFFKDFIYLFLERREEKELEKERNINVWLPLTCPLLQPRQVPWLGIEPVTLWFTGLHSIHCTTPARAYISF